MTNKIIIVGVVLIALLGFMHHDDIKHRVEAKKAKNVPVETISADFPYESKYVSILGSNMHYIDEGEGDPILFLHGNPTSMYLWRNVMPHLEENGRIIAVDLIGMGKSDKPDIEYTYADHYRYLEAFISELELENITLVIHDWGSGLGFNYAAQNEDNVAGIAFMEALTRPFESWESLGEDEQQFLQAIRTEGVGEEMVLNKNAFIGQFLPNSVVTRELSEAELAAYNAPFPTPESRKPILVWPRQIPVAGEPADVHAIVSNYYEWLQNSDTPKLMLKFTPGAIITEDVAEDLQMKLPNLTSVHVGPGHHFVQEDHPNKIGETISFWHNKLIK